MKKLIIDRKKWLRTKPGDLGWPRPAGNKDCGCFGTLCKDEDGCGTYGFEVPGAVYGSFSDPATVAAVNDYPTECGIRTARDQESALKRAAKLLGYTVKFIGRGNPCYWKGKEK